MGGKNLRALVGLVAVALVGAYVYVGVDVRPHEEYVPDPVAIVEDTLPAPPSAYGIPLDGFVIERGRVVNGTTFSDLLAPHGIDGTEVDSLVKLAAPIFDLHRLKVGHPFALIFTNDSARVPAFFVYEADQVDHVIFTLRPPMNVRIDKRPVRTEQKSLSVAVTGALWNDLENAGADPTLALKLSEVFQWTIDFYKGVKRSPTCTPL